ncbi:MAG: Clp protease N-terminal domain-containing protein [Phycisphaerae bacterium]
MPMQHLDTNGDAIVKLANELARDDGLEYVGTEHILRAILRHGSGVAAEVLHDYGVDEKKAAAAIEHLVQRAKEDTWVFGRLPGSPHFRNVVALAIDEATQMESKKIGGEHLLLALLRERDSTGQLALAKLGVTLTGCRERVLKRLGAG